MLFRSYYKYGETGTGGRGLTDSKENNAIGSYENEDPKIAIAFMFPCDFDYLSDLLNGLQNGQDMNTLSVFNPVSKSVSVLGNQAKGCGIGGFNYKQAVSNQGTEKEQGTGCKFGVEKYLLKRQARMSLLERDKIALRIVVPFNPILHAGNVIGFQWDNKEQTNTPVYGSGTFLISSMTHSVKLGGFSTTTLDCVASSVGQGVAG